MRCGQAGVAAFLHGSMTITAIEPKSTNVMLMTEWHRLITYPSDGKASTFDRIGSSQREHENQESNQNQGAQACIS
jgi:hypothetical protein